LRQEACFSDNLKENIIYCKKVLNEDWQCAIRSEYLIMKLKALCEKNVPTRILNTLRTNATILKRKEKKKYLIVFSHLLGNYFLFSLQFQVDA